jgi:MoxR-like ATPase
MRVSVGYPTNQDEHQILVKLRKEHPIRQLQAADFDSGANGDDNGLARLTALKQQVWDIHVDETLQEYIVKLVNATREHNELLLGGSPRASLALYKASQALAGVRGRDHVIPDDIKYLAAATLTHRFIVRPESELRGRKAADILDEVVGSTPLNIGEIP